MLNNHRHNIVETIFLFQVTKRPVANTQRLYRLRKNSTRISTKIVGAKVKITKRTQFSYPLSLRGRGKGRGLLGGIPKNKDVKYCKTKPFFFVFKRILRVRLPG